MADKPVIILGGEGHATVVAETLHLMGRDVLGAVARDAPKASGLQLLGDDAWLAEQSPDEVEIANGIGGTGKTRLRRDIFEKFKSLGFDFPVLCHPSAVVSASAVLGPGAQVMAGAVVQAHAAIGVNAIINSRASVDHHCRIGDHVHIAPGAVLSGEVTVEDGAHIGTGATIRQGIHIGAAAIVGVGAAVVGDVAGDTIVAGVPARLLEGPRS